MRFYLGLFFVLVLLSLLGIVPARAAPSPQDGSLFLPLLQQDAQPQQTVLPAIVGGQDAEPGEWPWQVFVAIADTYMCGGSIVDAEWVVTAAHCVVESVTVHGPKIFPAEDIFVVAGEHNLQFGEGTEQLRYVAEVIVHPAYNSVTNDSDLALLKLSTPIQLGGAASAVKLLSSPADDALAAPGTPATATGWGLTSTTGSNAMILQEVSVPIVANSVCSQVFGGITDNMICAGYDSGGMDTCYGDSGGPLVVADGTGGWRLAGITSFGPRECATQYGGYTRVSPFADWIAAHLEQIELTGFTPLSGLAGSQITISGSGLSHVTGVQVGGAYAQFTVTSDFAIVATVPPAAVSGFIRLTTPHRILESSQMFYLEYPLSVTVEGPGPGTVLADNGGLNCGTGDKCSVDYVEGVQVRLDAQDGGSADYKFAGWLGDCGGISPACTITMDAAKSVTAVFSPITPTLSVAVSAVDGGAGQVSSAPAGIDCGGACAAGFAAGSTVQLTAQPGPKSVFAGWSGACAGKDSICQVTMIGAQSVSALFQPDTYSLTVALDGDGRGAVTSFPTGIDCGDACAGDFHTGSIVNLSARAKTGSRFAGWGGACNGASPTCAVTVDAVLTVTASFEPHGVYLPAMLRQDSATQ